MLGTIRVLLLAAVGAIDLTEDRVRAIVDDLVRRGELAADEARELTARWAQGAAERRDEADDRLRAAVEEALGRHNLASHASLTELQARIAGLEQAVARLSAPSPRP
jgi:polyhydroxyalkanoate synthesis regulator phasin